MVWQRFAKPPGEARAGSTPAISASLPESRPLVREAVFENSRRVSPGSSNLSLSALVFEPVAQRIRALASEARGSQVQILPGSPSISNLKFEISNWENSSPE